MMYRMADRDSKSKLIVGVIVVRSKNASDQGLIRLFRENG